MNNYYASLAYNFALLAGASVLVAGYDWSLWTFFWAFMFMQTKGD